MPAGWPAVYGKLTKSGDKGVRETARALALVFDDPQAIAEVKAVLASTKSLATERQAALEMLVAKGAKDFAPTLQKLIDDPAVRRPALRGLAAYADEHTPAVILKRYATFDAEEKQDAIATLAARREYAAALLEALEKQRVPRGDVSSFIARQLLAIGDDRISQRVKDLWGDFRETPQDKLDKIAKLEKLLTPDYLSKADLPAGRRTFMRHCQQCHMLYGEGAKIGPDLTGSNRANLEYVLTNAIDPSAAIAREYRMTLIVTTEGRVLTGMIVERTGQRLTLQTTTERVVLVQDDIDELHDSPLSMMPEGQFDQFTDEQIRDLVGYLATTQQVELK
jgi:putative heme-binding domain-containing protein